MNKNHRKNLLILLGSVALIIGIVALVTIVTTSTMGANLEAEANTTENSTKSNTSSEKKAAEELIDKSVSKEKIKKEIGEWEKFEMSSNGCERGVYAGKFYYGEFTIFSRTYDKGKTFRIVSVNE